MAAASTRADEADVKARCAEEKAAGLYEQLRVAQEGASAAAEAAVTELRREREVAADMALGLQAQSGELKQHAAQVWYRRAQSDSLGDTAKFRSEVLSQACIYGCQRCPVTYAAAGARGLACLPLSAPCPT